MGCRIYPGTEGKIRLGSFTVRLRSPFDAIVFFFY